MTRRAKAITLFGLAMLPAMVHCRANARDAGNAAIHQMLLFLEEDQSTGTGNFPEGIFPAYRQYVFHPNVLKDDDNLFFTALVVFTLNGLYPQLTDADRAIARKIRDRAIPAFALYQNQKGRQTYNFWRTRPPRIFPHSGWMNRFDRQQALPDDFDDTSIGLLARMADTETVKQVHALMQGFTNLPAKPVRNTLKAYRHMPAYSVWFGQKFPVDFDVCVLANTLYLVSAYHLPWTAADSASLKLIRTAIQNKDIFSHPGYIAPHYHTTAIILYHLARLYAINPRLLAAEKSQLEEAAKKLWETTGNPVEKALLGTSLKRLGYKMPYPGPENLDSAKIHAYATGNFVFFIANMASMLPNPLKGPLGKWGIGQFNYYCPAYNIALLLEYYLTPVPGD